MLFRSNSTGTLRGRGGIESSDGVDVLVADDGDKRSGVDTEGLSACRALISGVEIGVGVLLYMSDCWKVFALWNGGTKFCRLKAS